MRARKRFYNVGADQPLAGQPVADRDRSKPRDAGAVGHPAPTLSEMQVVAAAWPIYDRLIRDEDPAGFRRLSSVWAEARQIAIKSLTAAKETA